MTRLFVLSTIGALALGVAAAAPAASPQSLSVAGTAHYESEAGGATVRGSVEVGARSDALGATPTGHITLRTISPVSGGPQVFHGDVSEGCLVVVGNTAVAVGRLQEDEEFDVPGAPPPFRIEFVAVAVQDNGQPVGGQPVDLAQPAFLRAVSAQRVCAGALAITPQPFARGNFVVDGGQ